MMTPVDLIREGRLSEARESLVAVIKAAPGNTKDRNLLFQVLAFCGEWDKAERHLDLLGLQNVHPATGVQFCKNLVAAERERLRVFRGEKIPSFMTKEPPYL